MIQIRGSARYDTPAMAEHLARAQLTRQIPQMPERLATVAALSPECDDLAAISTRGPVTSRRAALSYRVSGTEGS